MRYNFSHIFQKHRRVHTDIIAAVDVVPKLSCSLLSIAIFSIARRGAIPFAVRQLYFLVPCVPFHSSHAGSTGTLSVS